MTSNISKPSAPRWSRRDFARNAGIAALFAPFLSLLDGKRHYKQVGRSRKKLVGTEMREKTADERARADAVEAERQRLYARGIDYRILPSMKRERTNWSVYVAICVPMEIRRPEDILQAADLVRRLLRFETTLEQEFPGYSYGQEEWLSEAPPQIG